MYWFTATVIGINNSKSKIDIELPNGDKFYDVVIAYGIGKSERCFGYKQVQKGNEVIVLKNEGNSLIAIGQTSQTPSQTPSSMSETEVAQVEITKYMEKLEDILSDVSTGIEDNLKGIIALGGSGAGVGTISSINSGISDLASYREKLESMQESDACY